MFLSDDAYPLVARTLGLAPIVTQELFQTLGELNRENLSQRVLLRGLTENDVKRFVEVTAGTTPSEAPPSR